jgi:hypothetical protein
MESPTPFAGLLGRRLSALTAGAAAIFSLPLLAIHPQSGDGMEQVQTAISGGVLHPPGFPLQAWLNRLFIHLPFPWPATNLSVLSLVGWALMIFFVAETLRLFKAHPIAQVALPLALGFAAPLWALGTQPEVFALAYGLMAGLFAHTALLWTNPDARGKRGHALLWGVLLGLAGAQHPITVMAAPAIMVGAHCLLKERNGRGVHLGLMVVGVVCTAGALFLSLPLLRSANPWPDWGALTFDLPVLFRHALRVEYGTLSLAAAKVSDERHFGAVIFLGQLLSQWHVAVPLVVWGGVVAAKKGRGLAIALLGSLLLALLFLLRAQIYADTHLARAILERFCGVAFIPSACLLGMGLDDAIRRLAKPAHRRVGAMATLFFVGLVAFRAMPEADFSRDNTTAVYQKALGRTLVSEGVFLCSGDLETFGGALLPNGKTRHCVATGLLGLSWYTQSVLPRIDSRLAPGRVTDPEPSALARAAVSANLPVFSSSPTHLDHPQWRPRLEGLLYRLEKGSTEDVGPATVAAAMALCPDLEALSGLPPRGHHHGRLQMHAFARAFDGAAFYLKHVGQPERAALAQGITRALQGGKDADAWRKACRAFVRPPSALGMDGQKAPSVSDEEHLKAGGRDESDE